MKTETRENGLSELLELGKRRRRRRRSRRSGGEGDVTIGDMPVAFDDEPGDYVGSGARDVFVGTAGRHIARRGMQLLVHPVPAGAGDAAKEMYALAARNTLPGGGGNVDKGPGASASGSRLKPLKFDFNQSKTPMPATRCGTGFLHGFVRKPQDINKDIKAITKPVKRKKEKLEEDLKKNGATWTEQKRNETTAKIQNLQEKLIRDKKQANTDIRVNELADFVKCLELLKKIRPTLFRLSHYDAGLFRGARSNAGTELAFYDGNPYEDFYTKAAEQVLDLADEPKFQVILGNAWGVPVKKDDMISVPPSLFEKEKKWKLRRHVLGAMVTAIMKAVNALPIRHVARYEFDIWNEPNHKTFGYAFDKRRNKKRRRISPRDSKNPTIREKRFANFCAVWSYLAREVKKQMPQARIVGPSISGRWSTLGKGSWMEEFLNKCKKNQIPDIVSWHNLGMKPEINQYVKELIKYCAEKKNKSKFRRVPRVDVNETMGGAKNNGKKTEEWKSWWSPGTTVHFLADAERANFTMKSYSRRKGVKPPAGKPPFVRICRSRHGSEQDTVSDLRAAWSVLRCYAEMDNEILREDEKLRMGRRGDLDWIVSLHRGDAKTDPTVRLLIGRNGRRTAVKAPVRIDLSNLSKYLGKSGFQRTVEYIRYVDGSMKIKPEEEARDKKVKTYVRTKENERFRFNRNQGLRGWDAFFITLTPKPK